MFEQKPLYRKEHLLSKIITEEMACMFWRKCMYDVVLRDTADVLKACVVKYVKKVIENHKLIVRATHAMKGWRGEVSWR